jgi:hypothetical protein
MAAVTFRLKTQRTRDMTIADFDSQHGKHLTTVLRRVSGPVEAARGGVTTVIAHAPGTVRATQSAVRSTTSALQALPDSTLRSLAASSIGLGAGLYLAGRHRLAVAAGVGPALVVGTAIALRPVKPTTPAEQTS